MRIRLILFITIFAFNLSSAKVHATIPSDRCEALVTNARIFAAQAQQRAATLLAIVGKTEEKLLNPWNAKGERRHREDIVVKGVPEGVKRLESKGRVFRHYIREKSDFELIRETGILLSGPIPYVQIAPNVYKKAFSDLSGVFLTSPDKPPFDIGLSEKHIKSFHYVDIKVPDDFPVLEIEKDAIFLVPLRAGTQEWLRKAYHDWKAGNPVDPTIVPKLEKMDAEGDVDQKPFVPIIIVNTGQT